jgi:hypothetical protein
VILPDKRERSPTFALVRTFTILAFRPIAVHAKYLKPRREAMLLNPGVNVRNLGLSQFLAMPIAATVNVIQTQELEFLYAATSAKASAIRSHDLDN